MVCFSSRTIKVFLSFAIVLGYRCLASVVHAKESFLQNVLSKEETLSNNGLRKEQKWCDPVLGCLELSDDWYSASRPINVLPEERGKINTRFYLHTRLQPNDDTDYEITADDLTSLTESTFTTSKPTKFIVHGFIDTGDTRWLKEMAAALLDYDDYNVFRVDWGAGSKPMYYQAAANARVVGLEIGHLVNTLISAYGLNQAYVHCIGHSLGSHACGYAGEQIECLGRITGLDPAGPYYTGTADFIHLDPTDAVFVDVIHTDADSIFLLGYGTAQPMGNLDFYPNSGHDQPGCDPVTIAIDMITTDIVDASRDLFACSHIRAIKYFVESLEKGSTCTWLGHACDDYDLFEAGSCYSCEEDNSNCAYLGIRANEYVAPTKQFATFYLDTDKKQPFCLQHYVVSILTAYPSEAESSVVGKLKISLYGDTGKFIKNVQITGDHEKIENGQIKTKLFLDHMYIGHILRIELEWIYDNSVLNPQTYCWNLFCNRNLYVLSVNLSPINHYPESERLDYTVLACSRDGSMTEIKDGNKESFLSNAKCESLEGPYL